MKKIFGLMLCLLLLMLSVTAVAFDKGVDGEADGISGFSSNEVCIIPCEKTDTSTPIQSVLPGGMFLSHGGVDVKNIRMEDKYFPDILEQIDIISVAPRE